MPYILNKTNGSVVTTVQDASLDQTTDLTFLGRNYAGYGEIQNENFLKLLENFANTTAPLKKIEGQIWYDSSSKTLNVYDSVYWKPIANIETASSDPSTTKSPVVGNLWYDTTSNQLKVWNGTEYVLIGPPTGSDVRAQWRGDFEYDAASSLPVYNIKAVIGIDNEVVAIASAETYDMLPDYQEATDTPQYPALIKPEGTKPGFTRIIKGISLEGATETTSTVGAFTVSHGSSRHDVTGLTTSSYFWGTAGEALYALYATTSSVSSRLVLQPSSVNQDFYVPFADITTNDVYYDAGIKYNPITNILKTTASAALYADLAERYEADAEYEVGTVLVIGGEKEVTVTAQFADTRVAGIVSKNPAYMMNSEAGSDETHPYIALKGRVPCKVVGYVKKGDLVVTSSTPGYGCAAISVSAGAIIGKALGSQSEGLGIIEVLVV